MYHAWCSIWINQYENTKWNGVSGELVKKKESEENTEGQLQRKGEITAITKYPSWAQIS